MSFDNVESWSALKQYLNMVVLQCSSFFTYAFDYFLLIIREGTNTKINQLSNV